MAQHFVAEQVLLTSGIQRSVAHRPDALALEGYSRSDRGQPWYTSTLNLAPSAGPVALCDGRAPSRRAHLSTQAKAIAVRKAGGHVVEDAGAVHLAQEVLCCVLVLCTGVTHQSAIVKGISC